MVCGGARCDAERCVMAAVALGLLVLVESTGASFVLAVALVVTSQEPARDGVPTGRAVEGSRCCAVVNWDSNIRRDSSSEFISMCRTVSYCVVCLYDTKEGE